MPYTSICDQFLGHGRDTGIRFLIFEEIWGVAQKDPETCA